ncbi:MAG: gliding motility lipoprotein GldH [Lutibacter sp.]
MIKKISYLFLIALLGSCTTNHIFNQYQVMNKSKWEPNHIIAFNFKNTDTISLKNVFINVRSTTDYPFNTLYVIASIKKPSNQIIIDTLAYRMTDKEGNWLGTGISKLKDNKLIYKQQFKFSEIGNYQINIKNATRSRKDIKGNEPLLGVNAVGLSIENSKK